MSERLPSSFGELRPERPFRRWAFLGTVTTAVIVTVSLAFIYWRVSWVPRESERLYQLAYHAYAEGDLEVARGYLERVVWLEPRMIDAQSLLGWTHWRRGEIADAEPHFRAARELDPSSFDGISALVMVLLALDRADEALPILEEAARLRPGDVDTRLRLAEAYRHAARNGDAVALYREMLAEDPSQFRAEQALLEIFGYAQLGPETRFEREPRPRPAELQLPFRTQGDYFQAAEGDRWRTAYLTGANIGPGRPGEWAVSASLSVATYAEWLDQIADAGANTVRVYTILAPAFYGALAEHNSRAADPLWLIQEVWLPDDASDLYDVHTHADFGRELRRAIDVLHGSADLGCRVGHYCGIYTADVSPWVIGLGVGREVEPKLVRTTNRLNPERTSYQGAYVSLEQGTPAEAWFAEMFDVAARYETETYNAQRPLTVVNWPPLDPMTHPTEATYAEELAIRRAKGETVPDSVPLDMNDMDGVTIHVTRFRTEPAFRAGMFALYHVYQHWPDFMFLEDAYASAKDDLGPNRYLGYLLALKEEHRDFPLLIGEYGVSTSASPAHLHPDGWHNGGISEEEQAELLARFTRNIHDSRMAGGIVFEWMDEWWKQVHDEFTAALEPRGNDPLWMNVLDPEEHFGIVGFRPYDPVPLLRGNEADWARADTLYTDAGHSDAAASGPLSAVYATSDYGYLYLRVDLDSLAAAEGQNTSVRVALNTLPGRSGATVLPGGIRADSGANFLIELDGLAAARLLTAQNYNPWGTHTAEGRPDLVRIDRRANVPLEIGRSTFEELVVEVNQPRWARDGREYAPLTLSHGAMRWGSADPEHPDYDSRALWHVERASGMVELRIPWLMLLVTDPVARLAFAGTDARRAPRTLATPGVSVAVLAYQASGLDTDEGEAAAELVGAYPAVAGGGLDEARVYSWGSWERVRYRSYPKPAYHALGALWRGWPRFID